jgi:hypothetical protein
VDQVGHRIEMLVSKTVVVNKKQVNMPVLIVLEKEWLDIMAQLSI